MMIRRYVVLTALTALIGCGSQPSEQAKEATPAASASVAEPAAGADPANPALDPAALESRDCGDVVDFYTQAIQAGDYASAEKVWQKDLIPRGGLAKQFAAYRMAKLDAGERTEEGAAGSLYCEVPVTLTDGGDARKAVAKGTITLRRVNDVDGATPDQLRWHIEKSAIEGIDSTSA